MERDIQIGHVHGERLAIPDGIAYQLVYRCQISTNGSEARQPDGFFLWSSPLVVLRHFHRMAVCTGLRNTLIALERLARGRLFFGIQESGVIASWGWLTVGHCRHYWVEPGAIVIGPILTLPDYRCRGLATAALRAAMVAMAKRGRSTFYLDTAGTNQVARRVAAKCNFGPPIASYLRGFVSRPNPL